MPRYAAKPLTSKMGTPGYMANEGHIRLGLGVLKTLPENRNDQWIDIGQIIDDPQIFEFFSDIDRGEIDDALTHIELRNPPDAINIETKLNDETSVEYILANSGNCKRKKLDAENDQMREARQIKTTKLQPIKLEKRKSKKHRKTMYNL